MARPKNNTTHELTRAESQIMQIIWANNGATVNEIIAQMSDPKPAYNTVSTIARILADKGFVEAMAQARAHKYTPIISRDDYANRAVGNVLSSFFDNKLSNLVSFFSDKENLTVDEIDQIVEMLNSKKEEL